MGSPAPVTRVIRADDAEAVAALAELCGRARTGRPSGETAETVRHSLTDPGHDPDNDFFLTELDGALAAAGSIWAHEPYSEIWYDGDLDPRLPVDARREVLRAQLRRGVAAGVRRVAGRTLASEPRFGAGLVDGVEDDLAPVLVEEGFQATGGGIRMRIDLVAAVEPPQWPEGVTVRTAGRGERAELEAVLSEAFLDHQGDLAFSADLLEHLLERPVFRADATLLASDAGGPVGAMICLDEEDGGYVDVLGVLPRGRRRGLGRALLLEAFARFAATGTRVVRLYVVAESRTGAVSLYEGVGMRREQSDTWWDRPLRSAGSAGPLSGT